MWTQCPLICSPPPSLATCATTCTNLTGQLRYQSISYSWMLNVDGLAS